MIGLSWSTFRDRWQLFVGALVAVALGVALVQASLLTLLAAAAPTIPPGLTDRDELTLRDAYTGAVTLGAIIMVVTTFVAVFVVGSTFAFTVDQRRRDLALLRLVGARRGQVRGLLLGEAVLLGLLGTTAGALLGLLVARLESSMLRDFHFVPDGFTAPWHWWVLAVSGAVGLGVSVVGCLGASRRASRVRPLEALRAAAGSDRVMTTSRWTIGLASSAGALALMSSTATSRGNAAMDAAIPACLVSVVALSALSPVVAPAVGRVLEAVSARLFPRSRVAVLIHADLRDGIRRTASTAAPVILLVGLVVGLAGSIGAIDAGRRAELGRVLRADLVVSSDHPIGSRLSRMDGVRVVSEEAPMLVEARDVETGGGSSYEPAEAVAVDPRVYPEMRGLENVTGDWADLRGDAVALGQSFASRIGATLGEKQRVRVGGATRDLRVVAILPVTMTGPDVVLPSSMAPVDSERRYLVQTDGLHPAVLGAHLKDARGPAAGGISVLTAADWAHRTSAAQRQVSKHVVLAVLGLATLYLAIAVVNAVVIAAADRREEFATARLTGLSRALVVRTALEESLAVVLVGVLLGIAAATTTLVGVTAGVSSIVGTTIVSFPWTLLVATSVGATGLVAVTSVLTTVAATRHPPIDVARARE